jgi:hypothetical protein
MTRTAKILDRRRAYESRNVISFTPPLTITAAPLRSAIRTLGEVLTACAARSAALPAPPRLQSFTRRSAISQRPT